MRDAAPQPRQPRGAARASAGGAVALALVALAAGCGGDDSTGSTTGTTGQAAGGATDADAEIVRLVKIRGARLDADAAKLFGDRAQLEDFDAVQGVAPGRAAIAGPMRTEAETAAATLGRLAAGARTTSPAVAPAGQAFVGFEGCARLGSDFFGDPAPDRSGRALREADRTCDGARAAYAVARKEIERATQGATTQTGAGATGRVVIGNHAATDRSAKALVRDVVPSTSVAIVFRARDVSPSAADLRKQCAGPLTFTVTLALTGAPPAIDLKSGGYADTGVKTRVPARITGMDSFELAVGTFDVPATAAGVSRLVVVPSAASCPDATTGAAHAPSFSTGITDTLVLRVRR
ncbi:MAG TPA: hypothetical protein VMY78_12790 [Solirubrobacteraceae bacterium]|nr:hypothetical protein [Solirubrobacteraceae bacterium]